MSAVISGEAVPSHSRVACGGVQLASNSAWLWQLTSQSTFDWHIAGLSSPSHLGAVYMTLHPPLQLTIAPHMTFAFASSLQLPVHLPLHEPSQCAGVPGS
jgi:hypothetical protein